MTQTTEQVREIQRGTEEASRDAFTEQTPARKTTGSLVLGWASILVGLALAGVLTVMAVTSGPTPSTRDIAPTGVGGPARSAPGSANAAERQLGTLGQVAPQAGSANAAERQLGTLGQVAPPAGSANAAERQLGTLGQVAPQAGSANATERQLQTQPGPDSSSGSGSGSANAAERSLVGAP